MSDEQSIKTGKELPAEAFLANVTNDVPTDSVAAGRRDEGYSVVHAPSDKMAETARALLDAAEKADLPVESVRTSDGGFIVPADVADSADLPDGTEVHEGTTIPLGYGTAPVRTPGGDDDREARTSPDTPNAALQPTIVQDDDTDEHSRVPGKNANKTELRAWADKHGVEVDEDATVAELRDAIDQHANRPRPT